MKEDLNIPINLNIDTSNLEEIDTYMDSNAANITMTASGSSQGSFYVGQGGNIILTGGGACSPSRGANIIFGSQSTSFTMSKDIIVNGDAIFEGNVIFNGNVIFKEEVTYYKDTLTHLETLCKNLIKNQNGKFDVMNMFVKLLKYVD